MIKEEIAEELESKFLKARGLIRVTYKNGNAVYGSFHALKDYEDLRKLYKYRFIPSHEAKIFENEYEKVRYENQSYNTIIDCEEISKIEFV